MSHDFDVAVLGAGPGGYVAAIRAAQLGLKAAIIEKDKPGGVCLNWGCIPSKALIHQADLVRSIPALQDLGVAVDTRKLDFAHAYKKSRAAAERLSKGIQFLLKKNSIEYIKGEGRLTAPNEIALDGERRVRARAIILATGSRPRELPGLSFDETTALSSTGALNLKKLPPQIVILGAGAIGLELGYVWNAFGAEVTIIEGMNRILPLEDAEAAALVRKLFEKRGIKFITGAFATAGARGPKGLALDLKPAPDHNGAEIPARVEANAVLVAIGRVPNSANLGLAELGITLERGFVPVGDYCQTAARGVYAIGDLIATPQLAHVASKEGEIAAEHIAATLLGSPLPRERRVDPTLVPSAIYCSPEIASFGLQEEQAKAKGIAHQVFSFPYRGIGKAVATETADGFMKVVAAPGTGEILGAVIVGERATDLIHEPLLARGAELTTTDLADLVHAHPTVAEGIMEAARGLLNRAIHV
ncbi:MAG TPA: dihydrolipoyl dehydrogenase [Kiritimatiellia bacterium]|jgi:dihydrolipoamide dehydrogenase|nr:MAG: Dihydrolipoyl dehydrogenase [Verrucomicrobia bacterium ADurb.Bin018]HOE00182.1 dihydrolipoyl dehydrogenase [Kiritimatiellia bacterium]HOE36954.1 dihydrolipoyl dehydrogenase [Kiritimatiellia bacterium]HOR74300.1 dihydrolipoyl dehydrogenase [Kiritimatiellia bacterium]HOU59859.1 dihydrolipoyl dehydrogenase [Kiritimatiellia bacterium]